MCVAYYMQNQVPKQSMHDEEAFKGLNPRRAGNRPMEPMHREASRRAESPYESPPHLVHRHRHRHHRQPEFDLANAGPRHGQAPHPAIRNPGRLILSLHTPHPNPLGGHLRPRRGPTHVTVHQAPKRPQLQTTNRNWSSHLLRGDFRRGDRREKPERTGC